MKNSKFKVSRRALLTTLLAASVPGAWAAEYPERPIKLIVPYAAGGPTDVVARALAKDMANELGKPVIVENKAGASGDIAATFVAKSAPDGYTVLYHSSGFALSPALKKKPVYDPIKDFAPVSWVATIPGVLLTNPKVPATTVEQLLQLLKSKPGQLAYGSGGAGNGSHLAMVQLLQARQVEAVHVPYKGTNPALMDLVSGQVQFMMDALSSSLPFIRDQRVRVIATTGLKRSPMLPDVPTVNESGIPGFSFQTWHGLLLPAGTPAPIVKRLNAAATKAANNSELQAQWGPQGVMLQASSPAEFTNMLRTEVDYWAKAVKASGMALE